MDWRVLFRQCSYSPFNLGKHNFCTGNKFSKTKLKALNNLLGFGFESFLKNVKMFSYFSFLLLETKTDLVTKTSYRPIMSEIIRNKWFLSKKCSHSCRLMSVFYAKNFIFSLGISFFLSWKGFVYLYWNSRANRILTF